MLDSKLPSETEWCDVVFDGTFFFFEVVCKQHVQFQKPLCWLM
jgi:hypothetical protein